MIKLIIFIGIVDNIKSDKDQLRILCRCDIIRAQIYQIFSQLDIFAHQRKSKSGTRGVCMKKEDRRVKIVELLREHRTLRLPELAEYLNASVITVRRDLTALEEKGLIRKIYGGAAYLDTPESNQSHLLFSSRVATNHPLKQRIGITAAQLIRDDDSVILDIGTTCLEVARHLKTRSGITVLTNSVAILNELLDADLEVYALGGKLRGNELSLTGPQAFSAIRNFCVTKAFIGVGGISIENGITNFNRDSAELCSAIIERAVHVYLVADSSKFGKVAFSVIGDLSCVDTVITDSGIPKEYIEAFQEKGVEVIVC